MNLKTYKIDLKSKYNERLIDKLSYYNIKKLYIFSFLVLELNLLQ